METNKRTFLYGIGSVGQRKEKEKGNQPAKFIVSERCCRRKRKKFKDVEIQTEKKIGP